jgi:hypothetical protein
MVTFWESEEAICAFAGDDISVAKYYDFDKVRTCGSRKLVVEHDIEE